MGKKEKILSVDIESIIKEKWIEIVWFNFNWETKTLCLNENNKWYIWYDLWLDQANKNFYLAKELYFVMEFIKENLKNWHITTWDYNVNTWENNVKEKHIELAKSFEKHINMK